MDAMLESTSSALMNRIILEIVMIEKVGLVWFAFQIHNSNVMRKWSSVDNNDYVRCLSLSPSDATFILGRTFSVILPTIQLPRLFGAAVPGSEKPQQIGNNHSLSVQNKHPNGGTAVTRSMIRSQV